METNIASQRSHERKTDGKTYENLFIRLEHLTDICTDFIVALYVPAESDSVSKVGRASQEKIM